MKTHFDKDGSPEALEKLAVGLLADSDVQGLMVLGCDANGWTPTHIDPILTSLSKPLFGGIFPKIIYNRRAWDEGVLVIELPCPPEIMVISGLSDPLADYSAALEAPCRAWTAHEPAQDDTIFVFVDGLSSRIAALVEALFLSFGLERNFIGGGAGSLSLTQKPCLITPEGLVMDAGLVVRLPLRSSVGVAHGWQPITDFMKVTEADRNTILSLDWHPAFDRYQELVKEHSGWIFTEENFFDIAKCYPFGINKLSGEVVVRDPLAADKRNGLVCVGEVPVGSFVHLLNGNAETLISAAARARSLAEESAPEGVTDKNPTFLIDCISRALFLGDKLSEELEAAAGSGDVVGAMTLGEIANNGLDYLEFYNKTVVVALLGAASTRGMAGVHESL